MLVTAFGASNDDKMMAVTATDRYVLNTQHAYDIGVAGLADQIVD